MVPRSSAADRTEYPDTFGQVLRLHIQKSGRARPSLKSIRRGAPVGLILGGLAIAAAAIYPLL